MIMPFDLEDQGPILYTMVDYFGIHVKTASYDQVFERYHDLSKFAL